MPLPIITNVARVALHCVKGSGGGEPARTVNVIHVKKIDADTWGPVADAIADELSTGDHVSHVDMLKCLQSSYGYQSFDLTPLDGTSSTITRDGTSSFWPVGGHGGDYVPQVAAVLRLRTATRGRSGRGRLFLGPVAETVLSNGEIAAGDTGAMTTSWDAFANDLQTDHIIQLGVASYLTRQFHPVTDLGVVQHSATQRRRNLHT